MEFLVLGIFLVILNIFIAKYSGQIRMNWINSGLIVMFLVAPIVFLLVFMLSDL